MLIKLIGLLAIAFFLVLHMAITGGLALLIYKIFGSISFFQRNEEFRKRFCALFAFLIYSALFFLLWSVQTPLQAFFRLSMQYMEIIFKLLLPFISIPLIIGASTFMRSKLIKLKKNIYFSWVNYFLFFAFTLVLFDLGFSAIWILLNIIQKNSFNLTALLCVISLLALFPLMAFYSGWAILESIRFFRYLKKRGAYIIELASKRNIASGILVFILALLSLALLIVFVLLNI